MRILVFLIFFCTSTSYLFAQDLFSIKNSRKYANYLFSIENYTQAVAEYERIQFIEPNDSLLLKIISCYRKAGQFNKAITKIDKELLKKELLNKEIIFEYLKSLLAAKEYLKLENELVGFKQLSESDIQEFKLRSLMLQSKWHDASILNDSFKIISPQTSIQNELILKGKKLKQKNIFTAVILSTFVPGLGKVYAGNWKDGLMSFILTGGAAFQANRSFNKLGSKNILGYTYAGISTGFYLGNLVGSAKETRKRNKIENEKLLFEAKNIIFTDF
jgi:tetratricopeptide (TPR) repeat protein